MIPLWPLIAFGCWLDMTLQLMSIDFTTELSVDELRHAAEILSFSPHAA